MTNSKDPASVPPVDGEAEAQMTNDICKLCGSTTCGCRLGGRYKESPPTQIRGADNGG